MEKSTLLDDVLIDLDENSVKTSVEKERAIDYSNDVLAIVLLYRNPNFKGVIKPYNLEICGKKMYEWVEESVSNFEVKTIACDDNSNIVPLIKPLLNKKKTTIVLYSDTPLLTKETIDEVLDYYSMRHLNVLKLNRGWVFNTEYISKAEDVTSVMSRDFGVKEFYAVGDAFSLEYATNILKNRILDFHLHNGVFIEDKNSTFIDASVIIENGVKIEPNNVLKGETYIGKNVVLEPNNTILSSIISSGCDIKSSYIKNSKITENMVVGPFELIEEKES